MSGKYEETIFGGVMLIIGLGLILGVPLGYIAGGSYVKDEVCKFMYTKADNYIKCRGANLDDVLKEIRKTDNDN